MKAAAFFAAAKTLPVTTLRDVVGDGGLVVVAPHPDDESLGCGGIIAEACEHSIAVHLVVVSDGVGSHPHSRAYPPARLRALREAETRAAAAELGLDATFIRFLRLPDRSVPTIGSLAEEAGRAIAGAARAVKAGVVCVSWKHDPHCDHAAAAQIVETARGALGGARVFGYPIWGWTLPHDHEVGPPPRGYRIDVGRHRERKAAAIAAHRSQTTDLIDDDPSGFRLMPSMIANFETPYEILLCMEPCP